MSQKKSKKNTTWYTGEVAHEGFPLMLRFPEKPDFDALQDKYPKILVVTHQLEKVTSNGMPESDYNYSLMDFDEDMVDAFSSDLSGITVLVETFGGRRNYYMYITKDAPVDEVKKRFASKYPKYILEWKIVDDPGWKFIRRYSHDYSFYTKRK
jgi:hypothetical protein